MLVVVHPISVVDEAGFCHKVRGALGARYRRAKHAFESFTGMAEKSIDAILVELPLALLRVRVEILRVVYTVAHIVPVSFYHGLGNLWIML